MLRGGGRYIRPRASLRPVFERFTERARRVLVLAQDESRGLGHGEIGTEHLLLALIHEGDGVAARALASFGVSLPAARQEVVTAVGRGSVESAATPPFTRPAKAALERALREALLLGHNYIGTEHMLLGLLRVEGGGTAARVVAALGVDHVELEERIVQLLAGGTVPDAAAPDPPVCPRCRAPLAAAAAYRVLDVPAGDGDGDRMRTRITYCRACGTALAADPGPPVGPAAG